MTNSQNNIKTVCKQWILKSLRSAGIHVSYLPKNELTGVKLLVDLPQVVTSANPSILDVGANVGQSIEFFLTAFPQCRIHAFEPSDDCVAILRENFSSQCEGIHAVALGSDESRSNLYQYEYSIWNSLLPFDPSPLNPYRDTKLKRSSQVAIRTIDRILPELGIDYVDLLKIDTQGSDFAVLRGAQETLSARKVGAIMIEFNFIPMYSGEGSPLEMTRFLNEHGFHLVDYYQKERKQNRIAWCTALFCRL